MALVRVMWPETTPELTVVVAMLEGHGIPCFVHNDGFGGLHPGVQINAYNTRSIMVPEETVPEALALIGEFQREPPVFDPIVDAPAASKLRALVELLVFGWLIPGSVGDATAGSGWRRVVTRYGLPVGVVLAALVLAFWLLWVWLLVADFRGAG